LEEKSIPCSCQELNHDFLVPRKFLKDVVTIEMPSFWQPDMYQNQNPGETVKPN